MAATSILRVKNAFQRDARDFGVANTIKDYAFKAFNLIALFKVFRCMTISKVNPKYYDIDPKYTCKFLTSDELLRFSQRPEFELTEEYVNDAGERGHRCYAILDGDFLAAYGWYSNAPTAVTDELVLKFHRAYIYMYNGFTHRDYRGQRLHAIGMTRALDEFLRQGFKGIVSTVEETNYRSLQSVYRMGYQDFGKIYVLKSLGQYFICRSKGCREYEFSIEKA